MTGFNICVCGGGNISHAIAGMLGPNHCVNVLTRQPAKWNQLIKVITPKSEFVHSLNKISSDPADIIPDADIIIVSGPIYAIADIMYQIKDFINEKAIIISVVGRLFTHLIKDFGLKNNIIVISRTPYICRIESYGQSVRITGYVHKSLCCWFSKNPDLNIISELFGFDTHILKNIESINLNNSNSLLHPCRLYVLFRNQTSYPAIPLFYKDWCITSSELLLECDTELQSLIHKMNLTTNNKIEVTTILDHYEVTDAKTLTEKIQSIQALSHIRVPMIYSPDEFYADYSHRYFTEDVDYGLKYILDKALEYDVHTPKMAIVYQFLKKSV